MQIKKSLLIFAGAALLPCVSLWAQEAEESAEAPAQEKTVEANEKEAATGKEIHVTAAKHEMEMADVPMSVSVVDGDEVTRSSAATVADLIDDVPGVQVSSNGMPGFKQVNIRGEANSRVLILVSEPCLESSKSSTSSATAETQAARATRNSPSESGKRFGPPCSGFASLSRPSPSSIT